MQLTLTQTREEASFYKQTTKQSFENEKNDLMSAFAVEKQAMLDKLVTEFNEVRRGGGDILLVEHALRSAERSVEATLPSSERLVLQPTCSTLLP
eukprot:7938117-Pyramimonas_sp.AAC.2